MKLLYDQNLPPQLVRSLETVFPGSEHVRDVGLARASDDEVWAYAAQSGFAIATKDDDFRQRSFVFGAPPKIVWLRLGNCTTTELERVLRDRHADIERFELDETASLLVLMRG